MENSYSIYETKSHLSRLLKRVKNGQELIVTERGEPIARLVPYQKKRSLKDRIQELKHSGIILQRQGKKLAFPDGESRPGSLKRFLDDRE